MGSTDLVTRVDYAVLAEYGSWVYDTVATNLHSISKYCSKFLPPSLDRLIRRGYPYLSLVETDIANFCSTSQMTAISKNGIADIVKVGNHNFVHQYTVF